MRPSLEIVSDSAAATQSFAAELARSLRARDVVLLLGDLGAGKTTFVQGFVRALGIGDPVLSPTFILAQSFPGKLPVHHLDFYRVDRRQLLEMGVQDYIMGTGEIGKGIVLIEWADRCPEVWPPERIEVAIRIDGTSARRVIAVRGVGRRFEGIVGALEKTHRRARTGPR